jgi:hypothetical protein
MRNFRIVLTIITLSIIVTASAASTKSAIDLGIAGVGARPMGMGKSFVAIADDVNAVILNPAGLAFQESWGVTSMSTKLLNRVDYKMMGGIYPTQHGTFGIGYIALTTPAGYLTTDRDSLASATPISYGSSMLIASYAYDMNKQISGNNLGQVAVGGNLKFINNKFEGIDNASASGMEADLAVLIKPQEKLTLGANFQNFLMVFNGGKIDWSSGSSENIPSVFKLGAAYQARPNLLVSLDSDLQFSGDKPLLFHAGVEWNPYPLVALRAGIDQNVAGTGTASNLTLGTSVNFKGFTFDYAYRQDGTQAELSNHYFSLSFMPPTKTNLAAKPEKEEAAAKLAKVEKKKIKEENTVTKPSNQELSYEELMAEFYGK